MLIALAAAGCGRSEGEALPEGLRRLESCFLAQPVRVGGDWLLCGRFELTQAEYSDDTGLLDGDRPVAGLTLSECEAWCAVRGLRLPDDAEWTWLATGGAGGGWTPRSAATRNDLDFGLGRSLPVGVFERGRGPQGGYDFFGNVWERLAPDADGRSAAAGGSYAARPADAEERLEVGAEDRLEDVGMRYVADATRYVKEIVVPEWQTLSRRERERAAELFELWLPDLRRSFGDHLLAQAVPADLCALVRGQ